MFRRNFNFVYQQESGSDGPDGGGGAKPEVDPKEPDSLLDGASPELQKGEWFQSDGIKGTGDAPEWYQADHFKNVNEQAKGYAELQKKFGSFTGAPKDGYDMPESVDKDDALFQSLVDFADEANMNQKAFDQAWELLSTQSGVNAEINHESEVAKLGDNASQRIKAVENALKFKAGDGYDKIKDMITTADGVILAESLIKMYGPVKLPVDGGDNPTGVTQAEIELLMQEKTPDGQLRRSVDGDFDKKIIRMWTELLGDGPDVVTVS